MKLSRIDHIALNGATGDHYKYEEIADKIMESVMYYTDGWGEFSIIKEDITKILVENFPNE